MSKFKKKLNHLILGGVLILSPGIMGQQAPQSLQQQVVPPQGGLADDPGFKRISPEAQEWVRSIGERLRRATEQRDVKAIEQIRLEIAKRQWTERNVCGHLIGEGTFIDARVLSASHEEAMAIRWLGAEPDAAIHSAIFTGRGRCVATDRAVVDGKWIVRVLPNSLGVSNQHALVAWEAEYWDDPLEAIARTAHRGVFIEDHFLLELDPRMASAPGALTLTDASRDFRWSDQEEVIIPKAGVVLTSSPAPATRQPSQAGSATTAKSSGASGGSQQSSTSAKANAPATTSSVAAAKPAPAPAPKAQPPATKTPLPALKTPPPVKAPPRPSTPCMPLRPCPAAKH